MEHYQQYQQQKTRDSTNLKERFVNTHYLLFLTVIKGKKKRGKDATTIKSTATKQTGKTTDKEAKVLTSKSKE